MRRLTLALACLGATLAVAVTGCADTVSSAQAPTPTRKVVPRPLVERELNGLLLEPAAVAAALGVPAMAVTGAAREMADDSAIMSPAECLALDGAAEAPAYADSGFHAVRDQTLTDGDQFQHYAKQSVVLFPYWEKAVEYFAAATAQWHGCHDFVHTQSQTHWEVGPIDVGEGTLDTVVTQVDHGAPGWACGRSLVQRNNVVIDVNTCGVSPGTSAKAIASGIADAVSNAW